MRQAPAVQQRHVGEVHGLGNRAGASRRWKRGKADRRRKITHKKSQEPIIHRLLAGIRYRLGHSLRGNPNAGWRPSQQLCLFSGRL